MDKLGLPNLPCPTQEQRFPVRWLFATPGEEYFINISLQVLGFHIFLPKNSMNFEKFQGKNSRFFKKNKGKDGYANFRTIFGAKGN